MNQIDVMRALHNLEESKLAAQLYDEPIVCADCGRTIPDREPCKIVNLAAYCQNCDEGDLDIFKRGK